MELIILLIGVILTRTYGIENFSVIVASLLFLFVALIEVRTWFIRK